MDQTVVASPREKLFTPLMGLYISLGYSSTAWAAKPGVNLIQTGATQALTGGGRLGLNCNHLAVQGTLLVGPSTVKQANDITISGLLDGGSGMLNAGGNWTNNGNFVAGSSTVNLTGECVTGPVTITGINSFCNLNLSGSGTNYIFPAGNPTTVNCSINLGSNNKLTTSNPGEIAYIYLGPDATLIGDAKQIQVVIVPYTPPPAPIPTLGGYQLIALTLLLACIAARQLSLPSTDGCRPRS